MKDPNEGEYAKLMERYVRAGHRIQTALAFTPAGASNQLEPKHMRTGIDLSKADLGGLAGLLIKKGLITKLEYFVAVTESAEREADTYENELSVNFGINIQTI